jgi:hypothetical protein
VTVHVDSEQPHWSVGAAQQRTPCGYPGPPRARFGQVPAITCANPDVTSVHRLDHAPRSARTVSCPLSHHRHSFGQRQRMEMQPVAIPSLEQHNIARTKYQVVGRVDMRQRPPSIHCALKPCPCQLHIPTHHAPAASHVYPRHSSARDDIDHERVVFVRASCASRESKPLDQYYLEVSPAMMHLAFFPSQIPAPIAMPSAWQCRDGNVHARREVGRRLGCPCPKLKKNRCYVGCGPRAPFERRLVR